MKYKLVVLKKAKREVKDLPRKYQSLIISTLHEIREVPLLGKPLIDEWSGYYSVRAGVYRILYKIIEKDRMIKVYTIGHRSVVYVNDKPVFLRYSAI